MAEWDLGIVTVCELINTISEKIISKHSDLFINATLKF